MPRLNAKGPSGAAVFIATIIIAVILALCASSQTTIRALEPPPTATVSSYRLGDLVLLSLTDEEKRELLVEHPESIGAQYILRRATERRSSNIDIVTSIVLAYTQAHFAEMPDDISESTVIHLRLGDVVAGNEYHEKQKRPLDIRYIASALVGTRGRRYVIGKPFFAKTSSTNYDECIRLSDAYLRRALVDLNADHIKSESADIDLCCAVNAKLFVQGKGFFSRLIVDIRNRLKLPSIETSTHDT
jgi:hypothetical protein